MAKNINDVRDYLFAALEGLKTGSMEVDKAKAISDVSQTIINSAKIEIDYMKASGCTVSSGFIATDEVHGLPQGVTGKTVHRIK